MDFDALAVGAAALDEGRIRNAIAVEVGKEEVAMAILPLAPRRSDVKYGRLVVGGATQDMNFDVLAAGIAALEEVQVRDAIAVEVGKEEVAMAVVALAPRRSDV